MGFPWVGRARPDRLRSVTARTLRFRPGTPGVLATLTLPGVTGKLVYVSRELFDLDCTAVSATVDADPYFSRDGPGQQGALGGSAWHAVRVHHRCRPMGSPEAVCERVGSLMHQLHQASRNVDPGSLMDIVLLREAGASCIGSARDEAICVEVADMLFEIGTRPLINTRRHRGRREALGILVSPAVDALRRGGGATARFAEVDSDDSGSASESPRRFGGDRKSLAAAVKKRRREAQPELVNPTVLAALGAAAAPRGGVRQAPVFREDPRVAARPRADSVRRGALQTWLESDDGRAR